MSGSNPTLAPGSVLGTRPALRKDVRDSVPFGGSTDSGDARPSCGPGPGSMRRRVGTAARQVGRAGAVGTCCPLVCTARKRSDGPGAEGRGGAPLRGELT